MPNLPPKTYLGDSVYVEVERGMLKLTTENEPGVSSPSNTIYLEPDVYLSLHRYWLRCTGAGPDGSAKRG